MRIIKKCKIEYSCGIKQEKNLISHVEFDNVIKPKQKRIAELNQKGFKKTASILKSEILKTYGDEWFTNKSPLYKSIKTGWLNLPKQQGGSKPCIINYI